MWFRTVNYFDGRTCSFVETCNPFHPKLAKFESFEGFKEIAPIYVIESLFKIEEEER
jgi:hypothetical protein